MIKSTFSVVGRAGFVLLNDSSRNREKKIKIPTIIVCNYADFMTSHILPMFWNKHRKLQICRDGYLL